MPRKAIRSDVEHCEFHVTYDDRTGKPIRKGPCNGYCRIVDKMQGGFALTSFLVKLLSYSDADVAKADAKKAAQIYGIKHEHAEGYIRLELERRGLRAGLTKPKARRRKKEKVT